MRPTRRTRWRATGASDARRRHSFTTSRARTSLPVTSVVDRLALPRPVPRHRGEIGLVVAGVVLERRQQLQVQRVPQAQLDGRAAVGPGIEVRRDRLPVAAFRRGGQAQQVRGRTALPKASNRSAASRWHSSTRPYASGPAPRWPPGRGWSGYRWWRRGGPSCPADGGPVSRSPNSGHAAPRDRCAAPGAGSPRDGPRTAGVGAPFLRQVFR